MEIRDKKGLENLVTDHLSRLPLGEEPSLLRDEFLDEHFFSVHKVTLWYADIINLFPDEHLFSVYKVTPQHADIINFLATSNLLADLARLVKEKIKRDAKWDDLICGNTTLTNCEMMHLR